MRRQGADARVSAGNLLAALAMGFLGGVHCAGMCTGIATALTLGLEPGARARRAHLLVMLAAYNAGRIVSYTAAGALAGLLGSLAADLVPLAQARAALALAAAALVLAVGLHLGGWWPGVQRIERLGAWLWTRLRPLMRRLVPVRSPAGAFALGLLWGGIPCGLVYTALAWALAAADPLRGAALMAAFGLGTLPNLMALGAAAVWVGRLARRVALRRAAGLLVAGWGLWMGWQALAALTSR